jgi:Na+/H+-dicarboxylate symporter
LSARPQRKITDQGTRPARAIRTWPVLLALVGGLLLGGLVGGAPQAFRDPLLQTASTVGGLWLDALRMTVIPLIAAMLVNGIAGGANAARAGGVAGRSILWFIVILWASATFAGIAMPLLLKAFPLPETASLALRAGLGNVDKAAAAASVPTASDFLRSIIPTNPISATASGNILQIVVFIATFAFAITRLPERQRVLLGGFFEAVAGAMLVIIGWVLWLSPVGIFGLAFAVGAEAGSSAFAAILHYIVLVSALGAMILLFAYPLAAVMARWPVTRFARAMVAPQAMAISTQSSLATLPAMLAASETLGVKDRNAEVTLPIAVAIFRATSPAMNLGVAIYIAQWLGIHLGPWQIMAGIAVAATTTIGSVSLPGQLTFVTSVAPVALAMGIPIEPLAILIAVEPIPDIFRTLGNVTMDVVVTGTVDRQVERRRSLSAPEQPKS